MGDVFAIRYKKRYISRFAFAIFLFTVCIAILLCSSVALADDVTLAWDASSGADGYRLFSREAGGSYDYNSPDWEGTATTGTVSGLTQGTTYYFVVRAYNAHGESGDSNEESTTIGSTNQPPVLDPIGSKSVDEGALLTFTVTASDPDGDGLTFSASGVPTGASFNPSTRVFNWTPAFGDSGNYSVTFTVTDNGSPAESDSEVVTISVGNVNRPPVLNSIGSKNVNEGVLLSFTVTASDPDGDGLTFSASNVPTGASFNPSTRVFNWTPAFGDSGNYSVTFTVTDNGSPAESDSETVTISVGNVNRPPVLNSIGSKSVDEGALLTFTVTASDPDGDGLTFSASNVPTGASFNPSTRVFSWTPSFGAAGNYSVTFTVTDNGTPAESDSETVTISVGNVNRPPVLNSIGSKNVNEGVLLSFTVTASDPDGDGLTFSASNVPTGASFNPSTRVFNWTPAFGDSGNYSVTFTVTDNGSPAESDSETVTISVGNVNRPPVLGTIGSQSVDEGALLTFTVTASDPDGDGLTFSAGNVPTGASFNPSTRVYSWTPSFGAAGNYNVTFTVTDDGSPAESDSEVVTISVGNVNRPPVINSIGSKSVDEGNLLTFTVTASDPDGDGLSFSASNVTAGASFNPSTRVFNWTPAFGDAGNYNVTFAVTDDGSPAESDSETVTISVGNVNRPPVLGTIGSQSVDEGALLTFTVTASDPDGDGLTFSAGNVPTGASFNPSTRVFNWTPAFGDSGNYSVTFTVTDNGSPAESDSETVTITVGNVNRPPVLNTIGSKSVDEGNLLTFTVTASDPDGDGLTFSASNVPAGASFNPSTRVFNWTPAFGAAGNYNVTFTVTDDGSPAESDSEVVTISVGNVNRPPVLNTIGSKSVDEGNLLTFTVTASDPDGDGFSFSASNVPAGASFNPSTRVFNWTPAFGDAGNYNVTFAVTDDGSPAESDSETVTISVGNVNRPPVLGTIGSQSVDEGALLTFTVTASDPDGDGLTFSAGNVPTGASFNPSTRVFSWTPAFGAAGNYNVTFTVTDNGTPSESDSEAVTITVGNVNRPPVLNSIGSKSVDEGALLTFTVTASDPDGDGLTFSASNVPTGASFNPSTRVFSWTPAFGDSGNYSVTFTVTDDGTPAESDSETVTISVGNVNRPPVLNSIGSKSVDESALLTFTVTASDPDGDGLTFSASGVPTGASFNPSTRVFNWTPAFGDSGNYSVTFTVTDNGSPAESDSETVTISVGNVNSPPVLGSIGSKSVDEGDLLSFTISASDPDGDILTYSASNLPSGANFNSGTRTFSWTPAIGDAGGYNIQFTITDNGSPPESDLEIITITVVDPSVGNLAPDQPVINSPYYGETESDLLLTVETDPFSDPDGDAHKESRWQFVKQSDSSVVLDTTISGHLTELSVPHTVLDRDTTYSVSVQFYDAYSAASGWSDAVTFTTDSTIVDFDGDGIPDAHEVDDTVDLNEDGIPDNDQPDVIKSILSAVGGNEPFGVSRISASIDAIEALEPINPATILDKTNRPETFLFGLASYRLRLNQIGATVLVRVYYSEDISGANQYYLYDTVSGWQDYTAHTTFNQDGRSVTVELKDGGHGDSDGVANGIIVDPGGVAGAASGGLDSGAGSGCFIATAALDSYVEPHVKLQAASYLEEQHDWLKPIVRILLMPLVGVSYILVRTSLAVMILVGFLLIISAISFYTVIYRRRKYQA